MYFLLFNQQKNILNRPCVKGKAGLKVFSMPQVKLRFAALFPLPSSFSVIFVSSSVLSKTKPRVFNPKIIENGIFICFGQLAETIQLLIYTEPLLDNISCQWDTVIHQYLHPSFLSLYAFPGQQPLWLSALYSALEMWHKLWADFPQRSVYWWLLKSHLENH